MAISSKLVPHILKWEGGFVNDPNDLGGATNKGITIGTYTDYCRRKGYPRPTIDRLNRISEKEWYEIFKTMYWDRCRADEIKSQNVANMLVDWYWGSGIHATKAIQRIVGVTPDGIIGRVSLEAINKSDPVTLWASLRCARREFYHRIAHARPANRKYLRGWLNRLNDLKWVAE